MNKYETYNREANKHQECCIILTRLRWEEANKHLTKDEALEILEICIEYIKRTKKLSEALQDCYDNMNALFDCADMAKE